MVLGLMMKSFPRDRENPSKESLMKKNQCEEAKKKVEEEKK
jgi:hypothetical protein